MPLGAIISTRSFHGWNCCLRPKPCSCSTIQGWRQSIRPPAIWDGGLLPVFEGSTAAMPPRVLHISKKPQTFALDCCRHLWLEANGKSSPRSKYSAAFGACIEPARFQFFGDQFFLIMPCVCLEAQPDGKGNSNYPYHRGSHRHSRILPHIDSKSMTCLGSCPRESRHSASHPIPPFLLSPPRSSRLRANNESRGAAKSAEKGV